MANIGYIKKSPAGNLYGHAGTLSFAVAFWLVENPEPKRSDKTPTHLVMAKDPMGEPCKIGVIRDKVAKKTGETYRQIQFTDDSIPEKYRFMPIFDAPEDPAIMGRIVYTPPKPEEETTTDERAA